MPDTVLDTAAQLIEALQGNVDSAETELGTIKTTLEGKGYATTNATQTLSLNNLFKDIGDNVYDDPKQVASLSLLTPNFLQKGNKYIDMNGAAPTVLEGNIKFPDLGRGWRQFKRPDFDYIVSCVWVPGPSNSGYGCYVCILSTNVMLNIKVYADGRVPTYENYTELQSVDKTNAQLYFVGDNLFFCDGTNAYQVDPVALTYAASSVATNLPNTSIRGYFSTARTSGRQYVRLRYTDGTYYACFIEHNTVSNRTKVYAFAEATLNTATTPNYTWTFTGLDDVQVSQCEYVNGITNTAMYQTGAIMISATDSDGIVKTAIWNTWPATTTYANWSGIPKEVTTITVPDNAGLYNHLGAICANTMIPNLAAAGLQSPIMFTSKGVYIVGKDNAYHLANNTITNVRYPALMTQSAAGETWTTLVAIDLENNRVMISGGPQKVLVLMRGSVKLTNNTTGVTVTLPKVANMVPVELYLVAQNSLTGFNDTISVRFSGITNAPAWLTPYIVGGTTVNGIAISGTNNTYTNVPTTGFAVADGVDSNTITVTIPFADTALLANMTLTSDFDFYLVALK